MASPGKGAVLSSLVLAAAATMLLARRPPPLTEAEPAPGPVLQGAASSPIPPGRAGPGDVADALERVFAGCVTSVDADAFVVADLSGDGSEDLVVQVQAAESRLREVNDDLANWIVLDLDSRPSSPVGSRRITAGESLLAVIHGHGPGGWRSPEARQAYLLRGAVGVEPRDSPRAEPQPDQARTPRARGHVLVARLAEGRKGLLYWTGVRYSLAH